MRKKNGFTLVEIISVIGILLIIAAVAVPSVISINKRNKKKNYERIVSSVETSSENFIERYRSDIPFNAQNKYYFKLNVLGALNLIKLPKLPIKNPDTGDNIDENSCIEVTKNSDGTLSYKFPSDECPIPTSELTLELNGCNENVKKGTTVDLDKCVSDLKSTTTPKRYLKVEKETNTLNTSEIGEKTVTYTAIDLLNGITNTKSKTFNVLDDQKINVVFLSDSTTKTELDATDLETWKTELATNLTNNGPYKDIGIKYEVNVEKVATAGKEIIYNDITYDDDSNSVSYLGVYEDYLFVSKNIFRNSGERTCSFTIDNLLTNKEILNAKFASDDGSGEDGDCFFNSTQKLYCRFTARGDNNYEYFEYREYEFIIDKFEEINNENYTISKDIQKCRRYDIPAYRCTFWNKTYSNKTKYTKLEQAYNTTKNSNSNYNTHVNPIGLSYPTFAEITEINDKLFGSVNNDELYYYETVYNTPNAKHVFYDENKGNGFIVYGVHYKPYGVQGSTNYETVYKWRMIWISPEKFEIDLNNYTTDYNKTYLVVTANNKKSDAQKVNITNTNNNPIFVFGDQNTLDKFNITNSTEYTYTNINEVLSSLNNIIH